MSSQFKAIKLWGSGGANPPKVAIIMEELGLPYEVIPIKLADIKKPEYLAVNPNGRLPAIHDPNTDITLWESGAIIEYLIEVYDQQHRLSFPPGSPESYHAKQWLYFQASGQGPYYGQAVWFKNFHSEQLPGAIERYVREVNRVSGVLEGYLVEQKKDKGGRDGPWLVGNKLSYADLAFIPWQGLVEMIFGQEGYNMDEFPHLREWLVKMRSRETVKKVLKGMKKLE